MTAYGIRLLSVNEKPNFSCSVPILFVSEENQKERKKERKKARGQKYREHAWLNDRHREGKMSRAAKRKCCILGHNNKHVRFFSLLAANSAHK
jgi:hypothetical protein|tara:strand:+ start:124 stop:402 length:279 start_codon:yes stop_codon:yes gene_type:complete